ncbi:MAG: hypothetical protein P8Q46_04220 [Candidatus Thalassarchaeaceae archaeon]|nr:hypothetical protein [Candidatus Thalassarchaeaceae archaeon]
MASVVRLLFQPSLWACILLAATPLSSMIDVPEGEDFQRIELEQEAVPWYASSPGHSVFGEYVGAHWCTPCMSSASPSLDNLKTSNPEEFTFVSFFESSSGGWPSDGPINRQSHIMQASSGYPTFSFADQQSGSCYKVGASGTNYYDGDFSNGGCMNASTDDFQLALSMSLNSSTEEVSITLEAKYVGSESSVDVFVYGAVTEKTGADSYDNGVRPHHNWRGWLLNGDDSGFQELTLTQGAWESHTWVVPLSLVRAGGGNTQWENFWPVFALMDGPHTSYNEFLVAIDPDMAPLIDVGVLEFEVENTNQMPGFIPGDILQISARVSNNGVESYTGGGELGIYIISGSDEVYIGGRSIGTIGVAGSFLHQIDFDTSELEGIPSGVSTFRAKLFDMGSDRNSSNDYVDDVALHDMPPIPSQPAATGSTNFERGDRVQFETSALPNDLVDDMSSMSPQMQYSKSGENVWESSWISEPVMEGSGANSVYVHTIQTPPNAESGKYDTRVMWEDAAGQQSEWLLTIEAFELSNALPRVLSSNDAGFVGIPTVKIDSTETISLVGLVRDAETPLSMLSITSSDPEFKGWNSASSEITVLFDSILDDSMGNPIPQSISISIDDGEDVNSGLLLFNVIENGAPRWSPIPTQAVFEGGSASTILTGFLSDSDDNGNSLPASDLALSIVSNSNEDLIHVSIADQTITAITANEDNNGVAEVVVMADDGAKSSQTSFVFFVINVNDAPVIDISGLEGLTMKSGESASVEILPLMSDVDDPDEEIWVDVDTSVPGSVQFDHINGVLNMMWEVPGEHNVKLTLIDSHGDWSASQFIVTILDAKPLSWQTDFDQGDLEVQLEDFVIGSNPTVTITYNGDIELVDSEVRWSICNGIVGICHSAGASEGLGSFQAVSSVNSGLSIGDYLTLSVKAVDADGWDRSTPEPMDILVPTTFEPETTIPEVEEEDDTEADQQSGGDDSSLSAMEIVVGILVLMVFIGGGTMAGLYFSGAMGSSREEESKPSYSPPQNLSHPHQEETVDFEQPEEIHPPLPEGGLPSGWTMEQWKYYGEQYLERQN